MARKIGIALLWLGLGLGSWDAIWDADGFMSGPRARAAVSGQEAGTGAVMDDGTGIPPGH